MPTGTTVSPTPDRVGTPIEPRRRAGERGDDRGQTTVIAAAVLATALLLVVGVGRLGTLVVDRARARTAADAAALAGVGEEPIGSGRRAALEIAARNGAALEGYRVDGSTVEVDVRVGSATASSRAERVPVHER